jgi:hypothetical protein
MTPTTDKKRKPHTEERKKNIGLSRRTPITDENITQLIEWWKLGYVPAVYMMKQLGFGKKVYDRLLKEYCIYPQIKFMPWDLTPEEAAKIIEGCRAGIPCIVLAEQLGRGKKQMREIISKLSPMYGITANPLPRYKPTGNHLEAITKKLVEYCKANPKIGHLNGSWAGGVSKVSEVVRKHDKYKAWRLDVFERDRFQCVLCKSKENIQADHIKPFSVIIRENKIELIENALSCEELWDRMNGRTLCEECHRKQPTNGKMALKWKPQEKQA